MQGLDRWLAAYGAAWEAHDGAAAAALFSEAGVYCWGPYADPLIGRDAIQERWDVATAGQGAVRFEAEPLGSAGARAFVRWHTTIEPAAEPGVELDGIFVLDFASDGLCQRLQEWWLARPLRA